MNHVDGDSRTYVEVNKEKVKEDLSLSFYHTGLTFQSESALYSSLNFKELLARNRCNI